MKNQFNIVEEINIDSVFSPLEKEKIKIAWEVYVFLLSEFQECAIKKFVSNVSAVLVDLSNCDEIIKEFYLDVEQRIIKFMDEEKILFRLLQATTMQEVIRFGEQFRTNKFRRCLYEKASEILVF